jgi:hypothetical protein
MDAVNFSSVVAGAADFLEPLLAPPRERGGDDAGAALDVLAVSLTGPEETDSGAALSVVVGLNVLHHFAPALRS